MTDRLINRLSGVCIRAGLRGSGTSSASSGSGLTPGTGTSARAEIVAGWRAAIGLLSGLSAGRWRREGRHGDGRA